ncbi:MAG: hypothetical protein DSY75_04535 [Alteromonas sp.]|jgi:hypothetical protein|uniref:DUF3592 domain-containing protein n=2 Tax=Alteromonadales TaxID=135622 RepID=A0ABX5CTF0_9ALTE|nr:hypothetical protein C6Y39_04020 [Alteromonas gracilis]RUM31131.1 MAG: hypothetical protein DSY75_04535 [Alteromonas sp.]|tara:strand:+ start:79 stop:576 length:498 start_codon:yes stop_codon:yes gene_type:complete
MLEPSSSTYFLSNVESISASFNSIGLLIAAAILVATFKFTTLLQSLSTLTKLKPKYIVVIAFSVFLVAFTTSLLNGLRVHNVQNSILTNQTQIISGCITDHEILQGNSREEMFVISDVKFKYNDYATEQYFFANRDHNTFIKNGQCVTIVFLPKQENGILKIDKV